MGVKALSEVKIKGYDHKPTPEEPFPVVNLEEHQAPKSVDVVDEVPVKVVDVTPSQRVIPKRHKHEDMVEALEKAGVHLPYAARRHLELLEATTWVRGPDGHTMLEVPDNAVRMKALAELYNLIGVHAPKREEITVKSYEEKVSIIADLRENPQAAIEVLQRLVSKKQEQKQTTEGG